MALLWPSRSDTSIGSWEDDCYVFFGWKQFCICFPIKPVSQKSGIETRKFDLQIKDDNLGWRGWEQRAGSDNLGFRMGFNLSRFCLYLQRG